MHKIFVWTSILKIYNHQVQKPALFENCWICPSSWIVLYQSTNRWIVLKGSSATVPLVVLDNFYKVNCFFVNFFSPYCFHHVMVFLLYSYFHGLCILWFRHWQRCILRFVMRPSHTSLTSRQSIKGSHRYRLSIKGAT